MSSGSLNSKPTMGVRKELVAFSKTNSRVSYTNSLDDNATRLLNIGWSIIVLWYLLINDEKITPQFMNFVSCLTLTQARNIWVFGLWACFKEGFTSGGIRWANVTSVFSVVEMSVALFFAGRFNWGSFVLYLGMILLFHLRHKQPTTVHLTTFFFLLYYISVNFTLNLFDFFWNYLLKEIQYRHDDDFVASFSYKTH